MILVHFDCDLLFSLSCVTIENDCNSNCSYKIVFGICQFMILYTGTLTLITVVYLSNSNIFYAEAFVNLLGLFSTGFLC